MISFLLFILLPFFVLGSAGIGLGYAVHWMIPQIDIGIGVIIGTMLVHGSAIVSILIALVVQISSRQATAEEDDAEDEDEEGQEVTEDLKAFMDRKFKEIRASRTFPRR